MVVLCSVAPVVRSSITMRCGNKKELEHFEVRVGGRIKFRGFRVVRFVPDNGNRLLKHGSGFS